MAPPTPEAVERERAWRDLAGRVEDALLHAEIALRTFNEGLPVDWQHVTLAMVGCLAEWVEVNGVEVLVLPGWPDGLKEAS